jgi:hypothetical protein
MLSPFYRLPLDSVGKEDAAEIDKIIAWAARHPKIGRSADAR